MSARPMLIAIADRLDGHQPHGSREESVAVQRVGLSVYDATGIATKSTRLATGAMVATAIPTMASVGEIIVRMATRRRSSRLTSMLNRLPTAYPHAIANVAEHAAPFAP